MKNLKPKTVELAIDGTKKYLQAIQKKMGFIPNMLGTFANSPAMLEGYLSLDTAFGKTSFTPVEQQLILLTVSVENMCMYCVAAHATLLKGTGVDSEVIKAVRNGVKLSDRKLNALVALTRELVVERGFVTERTKEEFVAAGYSEVAMMEVLIGVALKTISNYLDHVSQVPIDVAFQAEAF
jgi:uncharacterized peroxidase-related enzyme